TSPMRWGVRGGSLLRKAVDQGRADRVVKLELKALRQHLLLEGLQFCHHQGDVGLYANILSARRIEQHVAEAGFAEVVQDGGSATLRSRQHHGMTAADLAKLDAQRGRRLSDLAQAVAAGG